MAKITNDININLEKPYDVDYKKLLEIMDSFGVKQFVESPTHEFGELLDVIIASEDRLSEEVVDTDVVL